MFKRLLGLGIFWIGIASVLQADDWPQWLGTKRDGIWREEGILDKFPKEGPKVLWRQPIGGGYGGPAIVGDKLIVMDRVLGMGAENPKNAFDKKTIVPGKERVLCLNSKTGEQIWVKEYESNYQISYAAGPRVTPTIDEDRVYTLGAMGHLSCWELASGKLIWTHDLVKEYEAEVPMWGFSAHPLVDGDKLICLVGGSADRMVMAFDKKTGEVKWGALTTKGDPGYCPPMIYPIHDTRQLIIWHSDAVVGLDPDSGKKYWEQPFKIRAALTAPTPRLVGKDRIFVTAFYNGPMMLKVDTEKPGVRVVWKGKSNSEGPDRTDGLHSIMTTPFLVDNHIYGVCSYGELRCLKADSGERLWFTHKATTNTSTRWGHAFLTPNGDRWFLFNELGELIIAKLSPNGYEEIDRAKLLEPTNTMPGRKVVWMHPAYAQKCFFGRNDKEIICVSLAK